jgi:hypothetical protein
MFESASIKGWLLFDFVSLGDVIWYGLTISWVGWCEREEGVWVVALQVLRYLHDRLMKWW